MSGKGLAIAAYAVALLVAKLAFVSGAEIVSEQYDAWAYVAVADGHPFTSIASVPPGYPMWLWLVRALGVPQRIAIEVLLAASAAVLAHATPRPGWRFSGFALVYTAILFSPATFFLFDRALSDGFYLCLCILALGLGAMLIRVGERRWWPIVALGLVLGAMSITRSETPLVAALLVSVAVLMGVAEMVYEKGRWRVIAWHVAVRCGIAALFALVVLWTSCALRLGEEGVWAIALPTMPSHTRLLANLAAIEVRTPQRPHVPISREARLLAYGASPSLARLAPRIEDPANAYQAASFNALRLEGEIGAGWIWHVFNDAAQRAGMKTARTLDPFYREANRELEEAFESGRLHKRFVIHPLVGADPTAWLGGLGASIGNVVSLMRRPYGPMDDIAFDPALFDRVCLRRSGLMARGDREVKGWAFAEGMEIAQVSLEYTTAGAASRVDAPRHERPDVRDGYRKAGRETGAVFGFAGTVKTSGPGQLRLSFALRDGTTVVADEIRTAAVRTVPGKAPGTTLTYGIDSAGDAAPGSAAARARAAVALYSSSALWIGAVFLALAGLVAFGVMARGGDAVAASAFLVGLLVLAAAVCRIVFYAVIDAAAWTADARYVHVAGMEIIHLALMGLLAAGYAATRRKTTSS